MKLSEKIITLRNQHHMSQGDLAEKLNVSRQSVSKWETGTSTPDLDKLIAMSELFQVTMDELVKERVEIGGQDSKETEDAQKVEKTEQVESFRQAETAQNVKEVVIIKRILPSMLAGITLITFAPIYFILSSMGFDSMSTGGAFLISAYAFACGLICLFSNKHVVRRILFLTLTIVVVFLAALIFQTLVNNGIINLR